MKTFKENIKAVKSRHNKKRKHTPHFMPLWGHLASKS